MHGNIYALTSRRCASSVRASSKIGTQRLPLLRLQVVRLASPSNKNRKRTTRICRRCHANLSRLPPTSKESVLAAWWTQAEQLHAVCMIYHLDRGSKNRQSPWSPTPGRSPRWASTSIGGLSCWQMPKSLPISESGTRTHGEQLAGRVCAYWKDALARCGIDEEPRP